MANKDLLSVEYKDKTSPFEVVSSRKTEKPVISRPAPSDALQRAMAFLASAEDESAPAPVSIEEGFTGEEQGVVELNVGLVPAAEDE